MTDLLQRLREVENPLREVSISIEGTTPILMHNPLSSLVYDSGGGVNIRQKLTPAQEAETYLYWDKNKTSLVIPSIWIRNAFMEAGKGYQGPKGKKSTMKASIGSSVEIMPIEISLNTKNYDLDIRRVCIANGRNKSSILRARPTIFPWKVSFSLFYDSRYISTGFMREPFIDIICDAGNKGGLGDYRPPLGWFGKFKLVGYELRD